MRLGRKDLGKKMSGIQRQGALRVACSYRTVSEAAILVIAGIGPIDLLAQERKKTYFLSRDIGRSEAARRARTEMIDCWQERWNTTTQARWTRRVIKDLAPWCDRQFGEVNFYLTQFLSGHGYFRNYLHQMEKVGSPYCRYCELERDSVEHTFFCCEQHNEIRNALQRRLGVITPDNIASKMLQSQENWEVIAVFVESILRKKKTDGCLMD